MKPTRIANTPAAISPAMSPPDTRPPFHSRTGIRRALPQRSPKTTEGAVASATAPSRVFDDSASRVVLDDQLDFTGHGDLGALRTTDQAGLELVDLDVEVGRNLRQHVDV